MFNHWGTKARLGGAGIVLSAASLMVPLLAVPASADPTPPTCPGASHAPLTSGTYPGLTVVAGYCVVPAGANITVNGDVTIQPGGTLLALAPQTMTINGNISVGSGATLALGTPGPTNTPSHDTVNGAITATDAKAMYLFGDTVTGDVSFVGGGWGNTCTDPNADSSTDPIGHDLMLKDSTVGGSLTLSGWSGCWMGVLRNTIGGDALITGNYANPANINNPGTANEVKQGLDSTEIVANRITGNLTCSNNTPQAQFGDALSDPANGLNFVSGTVTGECVSLTASSAVARLAGADRYATAVTVSQAEFPTGGAGAVVLARGDDFPDALVGTPLAAAKNAPTLLTTGSSLPAATKTEIMRVLPAGGTVYVLGSTTAVPASIATELTGMGYQVTRYGGADRYATAVAVADALGDLSTVLLATGANFPDALSAGVAAAKAGGVVLLTSGTSLPAPTSNYLSAHPGTVYAVGGPAATADKTATALVGADRYTTAVGVAQRFFPAPTSVGVATGTTFPDAVSGGALLAHTGAPLLLATPTGVPGGVATYLGSVKSTVATAHLFGSAAALAPNVQALVQIALGK